MHFYTTKDPDRRERILYAALLLFTSKGYANTSVHEIREKADVSIGLIYKYFKNKEEIAIALYKELLADVTNCIAQLIKENDTVHDKCRAILSFYFERAEANPEIVDYVLFLRHHEISTTSNAICTSRPAELVLEVLKKGIEDGDIRKMRPVIAQTSLFGSGIRLMQMRIIGALKIPLPELLDETWDASWRAVAP